MSSIDLFLLGFLLDRPWNAYDLAKFIETNGLQEMIKISTPAVYKNCKKLAERGYLACSSIQENNMPKKKIYTITPSGRAYFRNLMKEEFSADVKYHFAFNAGIMNLDKIPETEARIHLETLRGILAAKRLFFRDAIRKYHFLPDTSLSIVRQLDILNSSMIEWLDSFISVFQKKD